jgi:formate dehydrogenase subunit delta
VIAAEGRLGNDIARHFAHLPEEKAVESVVRHLETFWDPRMRSNLRALAAAGDDTLDPLLVLAAGRLRDGVKHQETEAQP